MTVRAVVIFNLVLASSSITATAQVQTTKDTSILSPLPDLEGLLEEVTKDAESSELLDVLVRLQETPIDLNSATGSELQQLPGMSPLIANNIVAKRSTMAFLNVDDLLQVDGISEEFLERIRPFIRVQAATPASTSPTLERLSLRSRSVRDIQERRGFREGAYLGSPLKIYNRVVGRFGGGAPFDDRSAEKGRRKTFLEAGLLTEKDAGEQRLADFSCGYLMADLPSFSSKLIVGDFVVEAGEGLVFWRSSAISKGTEVISSVRKNGAGMRPYLSTDENRFFRGAALQIDLQGLSLGLMYSNRSLHASVDSNGVIRSIDASGLFRTEGELRRRGRSRESVIGIRAAVAPTVGLKVGLTAHRTAFAHPVELSKLHGFRGNASTALGVDASYVRPSFNVFGEVARDKGGSMAGIAGAVLRPHRTVDLSLLVREFPADFTSLHGFGFQESAGLQNERGVYFGLRLNPASRVTLSTYFDQYVFPRRTSTSSFPSAGSDLLTHLDVKLSRRMQAQLQLKRKENPARDVESDEYGRTVSVLDVRIQNNYRATLEFIPSKGLRWRSRVEWVTVDYRPTGKHEEGYLLYQEVRAAVLPNLLISARVATFHTNSFDARLYAYESDVLGTFSNPALFGRGVRWYVVARCKVAAGANLWLKYTQTVKDGVKTISSGLNEISGDLESRISIQLDVIL